MSHTPRPWRKLLAPIALSALGLLALSAASSTGVPAATGLLPEGALGPTPQERLLAPRIASILEQNHYRHIVIDDKSSPLVFDRFLAALDGQHSYFLAGDVTGFERWRTKFGDMIHTGEMDPAYLIFNVFQQRNRERINHALKLLDTEPDWTVDESFNFDREHTPWPATQAEMDELWRLRIKNDAVSLMLTGKSWSDTADLLRKRYQRVLSRLDKISPEDVFESLMNAYCAVYDPHSNYFSPRSSEEYRIQMSLSYEGIGASLQLTDDYISVTNILPGGPAAADGSLKPNDRITGVAQGHDGAMTDVIGWRLDDVVQQIRGKVGTIVRLQILPAGATPGTAERIVELTRNKVTLEAQAAKKEVRQIQRNGHTYKVGIITVPSFYNDMDAANGGDANNRSTTHDVRRLLQGFAATGGIDALVLDLRGDGGGYLPEAIGLTHLFINHGPVVQLKDTAGQLEVLDEPDPGQAYSGPAGRTGGPHQRLGLRDLLRCDPGLPSWRDHRPDHLRQGHRTERDSTRSLVLAANRRPGDGDDRQVLSHHWREHAATRRRPRYRSALADQRRGCRRERTRARPALGPDCVGAVPGSGPRAKPGAGAGGRRERSRRAQCGLSVAAREPDVARHRT